MLNYKLKIGVLPIRRCIKEPPKRIGMFQSDYAVDNKNMTLDFLRKNYADENTEFVDIEWLNEEGLLRLTSDCDKVVEYFQKEKIDALFVVNCNFGEESCAGLVAKKLGLPTLLWGPRDRLFDNGQRFTDTQCGLFAISKQLKRYGVKFSYIENCDITAPAFDEGVKKFLGVACMVKNFKNIRVLEIGARLKPFKSIMYNELELTEKFGVDVVSINLIEAMNELKAIYESQEKELEAELPALKEKFDCTGVSDEILKKLLAVCKYFESITKFYDCNIIGTDCWSGFATGWGVPPCLAMSLLVDKDIHVTCEGDIHMAITNVLLLSATRGKECVIQGEFTSRHPENDNAELLWHCGSFPVRYAESGKKPAIINNKPVFKMADGEYTIARFQADAGKYYMFADKFKTCDGPTTWGTYMWAEFDNLPALEKKLIEGPYIHHMTEIPGDYTEYVKEFVRYVDELEFDCINK